MALYDYHCKNCGADFEVSQPMSSVHQPHCSACGSKKTRRLFSNPPGIVFSTTGFYHVDSGKRFESQLSPETRERWHKQKAEANQ